MHSAKRCTLGIHSHRGKRKDWCPVFRASDKEARKDWRGVWVKREEQYLRWNETRRKSEKLGWKYG